MGVIPGCRRGCYPRPPRWPRAITTPCPGIPPSTCPGFPPGTCPAVIPPQMEALSRLGQTHRGSPGPWPGPKAPRSLPARPPLLPLTVPPAASARCCDSHARHPACVLCPSTWLLFSLWPLPTSLHQPLLTHSPFSTSRPLPSVWTSPTGQVPALWAPGGQGHDRSPLDLPKVGYEPEDQCTQVGHAGRQEDRTADRTARTHLPPPSVTESPAAALSMRTLTCATRAPPRPVALHTLHALWSTLHPPLGLGGLCPGWKSDHEGLPARGLHTEVGGPPS